MNISGLALTGNVLLVQGSGKVVAWLLTEGGGVDGIFGNRRADCGDSIWVVQKPLQVTLSAKDHTAFITCTGEDTVTPRRATLRSAAKDPTTTTSKEKPPHIYNTETGKVLKHSKQPINNQETHVDMLQGSHNLHYHCVKEATPSKNDWPVSEAALQEGWVKDPECRHKLWLPVEWRVSLHDMDWCHVITTLQFRVSGNELIIIKF